MFVRVKKTSSTFSLTNMRLTAYSTYPDALIALAEQQHLLYKFVNRRLPTHAGSSFNEYHDKPSLFSISNFINTKLDKNANLIFLNDPCFFVSIHDVQLCKDVLSIIRDDPSFIAGMVITDIQIQETPIFPDSMRFFTASPVLVKKFDGKTMRHLTFNDPEASDVMTKTMQTKLRAAGLDAHAESVRVRFDTSYAGAKTKLIDIHGIKNRANVCPVIVSGSPEAVAFAWDVGVGHSTGAGFGALR